MTKLMKKKGMVKGKPPIKGVGGAELV